MEASAPVITTRRPTGRCITKVDLALRSDSFWISAVTEGSSRYAVSPAFARTSFPFREMTRAIAFDSLWPDASSDQNAASRDSARRRRRRATIASRSRVRARSLRVASISFASRGWSRWRNVWNSWPSASSSDEARPRGTEGIGSSDIGSFGDRALISCSIISTASAKLLSGWRSIAARTASPCPSSSQRSSLRAASSCLAIPSRASSTSRGYKNHSVPVPSAGRRIRISPSITESASLYNEDFVARMLRMDVVVPEVPLLQTYVDGLDRVLGGGIPKGSTVLIAGTPGTMKTSLILWMMQENGRAHGVKSLYISLEQDMDSLKAGAARMGMGVLHESTVYVLDMGQLRRGLHRAESTKDWFTILTEIVKEAVASSGYQVLAIDSLEALYALSDLKTPRREMFHFLGSLKELGLTTFLIAETPFGSNRLAQWGEDFLADGILHLRQVEVGETEVQLRLRCVKMRWMNHDKNALALHHDGEKFFVSHVISKKK
ncbi:MAG: hypothetical protein E6J95_01395 [Methanobacteriota archaeon]|nr:MAG: hypothetical protein E6J95_01395 [Euryarchaeota archaeon]